jgi:hypothetical protein
MLKKTVLYDKSQNSKRVVNSTTDPYIMIRGIMSLMTMENKERRHERDKMCYVVFC